MEAMILKYSGFLMAGDVSIFNFNSFKNKGYISPLKNSAEMLVKANATYSIFNFARIKKQNTKKTAFYLKLYLTY